MIDYKRLLTATCSTTYINSLFAKWFNKTNQLKNDYSSIHSLLNKNLKVADVGIRLQTIIDKIHCITFFILISLPLMHFVKFIVIIKNIFQRYQSQKIAQQLIELEYVCINE